MVEPNPFCMYPWFHQDVSPAGNATPCCIYWPPLQGETHHSSFFHGKFMQQLRDDMLAHNPPATCYRCTKKEHLGTKSPRMNARTYAKQWDVVVSDWPSLISHTVNLSNLCNLACLTCNSARSTRWISDELALGMIPNKKLVSNWHLTIEQAKTVRRLEFMGGEPLLHQTAILEALKLVSRHGRMGELSIEMTSNCTVEIDESLLELMLTAGQVHIGCSIDAVGKLNDYIRWPSNWERLTACLDRIVDLSVDNANFSFSIFSTISIFNINRVLELLHWIRSTYGLDRNQIDFIFAQNTEYFNVANLPDMVKDRLEDELRHYSSEVASYSLLIEAVIRYLKTPATLTNEQFLLDYARKNRTLDARRGIEFADVNPEMSGILEQLAR